MSLYIRLSTNFFSHRKTARLRAIIGDAAFWLPPRLWVYAAENQPDGIFRDYSADELAMLLGCSSNAQAMLGAFIKCGFMDENPLRIHGWEEHNGFHRAFSERASKAAKARWAEKIPSRTLPDKTGKEMTGDEMRQALPHAMLEQCVSNAPSIKDRSGLPATDAEAVEWAGMEAVPAEFATAIFTQMESCGWIDGAQRQVTNFRAYVKSRYSRQKTVASSNGKLSGAERVSAEKELERAGAEIRRIRENYESHQDWGIPDKQRIRELKEREKQLKTKLGAIV